MDIQINEDGCPEWAYITRTDLNAGRRIVYLGGDMDALNLDVRTDFDEHVFPDNLTEKLSKSRLPATMYFQEGMSDLLMHEICHILIYELTGSHDVTRGLDRLDFKHRDIHDILAVCDERR